MLELMTTAVEPERQSIRTSLLETKSTVSWQRPESAGCCSTQPEVTARLIAKITMGVNRFMFLRLFRVSSGGTSRDRTDDLLVKSQLLYLLSYSPESWSTVPDLNREPLAYEATALTD